MANASQTGIALEASPNRSGMDKSHEHYTTARTGQLIPVLCDEILPNTSISLGALASANLLPFAAQFNGKIDLRMEAFFVPSRLLWEGWKSFEMQSDEYNPDRSAPSSVPTVDFVASWMFSEVADLDYIWSRLGFSAGTGNVLPAVAYERIWHDWYRDARIQKGSFDPKGNTVLGKLPWTFDSVQTSFGTNSSRYENGHLLGSIRQRNFDRDYFTTALTSQSHYKATQAGTINFDDDATLTIGAIRQANTLQRFFETLGNIGNDFAQYQKTMYGCYPRSERMNKSVYLGSARQRIYSNEVMNMSNTSNQLPSSSTTDSKTNPYRNLQGAITCNPFANASSSMVDNFTTDEHGYLFVIASIVPILPYSSAVQRFTRHIYHNDFGNARFAGLGNQPIFANELNNTQNPVQNSSIFGWSDRFAEYKVCHDRVTGGFMEGGSLNVFSLKRSFQGSTAPSINSSFLEIPVSALWDVQTWHPTLQLLDEVENQDVDEFYRFDVHRLNVGFVYRVVQPLPMYSIPTLCEFENAGDSHKTTVTRSPRL